MILVVGSGPAGVSCAHGLLRRGRKVTLVDGGVGLDPTRASAIERLGGSEPGGWHADDLTLIADRSGVTTSGPQRKLLFGSDFPYRPPTYAPTTIRRGVALEPSYARGGFSTVWGAALLPYTQQDLSGWPIGVSDLAPFYAEALGLMPVSAVRDALAERFPLYVEPGAALKPSPQAGALLNRLEANRERLEAAGIQAGASRLAVRVDRGPDGCRYCGRCLLGCPYGHIYRTTDTLEHLRTRPGFQYRPGWIVEGLSEGDGGVEASLRSVHGERERQRVSQVFLAAGTINTTRLLLTALEAYDTPVRMRDSQYFLLPLLQTKRIRRGRDAGNTLSQIFLEVDDPRISAHRSHLQVYTHNSHYAAALRTALGRLAGTRWLESLESAALDRFLVVQGYLHSSDSAEIEATLHRPRGHAPGHLELEARANDTVAGRVRKLLRKLLRNSSALGMVPLLPLLKIGEPGRGYHAGGTFPMTSAPDRFASDVFGRPAGLRRTFAVDSTTFPVIPAGPITLSVMANALRIAACAPEG